MATDSPLRLVAVFILTLVVSEISGTAIPKLQTVTESTVSNAKDVETEQDTSGSVPQLMVLKDGTANGENAELTEFSYDDENVQPMKTDDPNRYFYSMIDSQKTNGKQLNSLVRRNHTENHMVIKITEEDQNPKGEIEEGVDSVPLWTDVLRPTEQNVPGFYNLPKHIPEHLRPISPFPEGEPVTAKGQTSTLEKHAEIDDSLVHSGKIRPPPRAGPYLYPQSIVAREFRVPFY